MPIFEYRCAACGHLEELLQKHNDPAPAECPACGKSQTMGKELSASAFHLKGGGWYKDLYSSSSPTNASSAGGAPSPPTNAGSAGGESTSTSTGGGSTSTSTGGGSTSTSASSGAGSTSSGAGSTSSTST
ncbi:MAG: zinc ribbon domain-containing protein [Deltaproteobacteria bacterium]|nr:zinc ribbon domain-containing protein [Deltaproteobacteria bacterium]